MGSDGHAEGSPAVLLLADDGLPVLTILGTDLRVQVVMGMSRREAPAPQPAGPPAPPGADT
ncbi:hypothetical protein GCM10011392_21960 [Wenxinia marina]|uniref:Uncharacterized protein n=1 Tax=Wenxinia marina DSM 24838 TaxID=1123501 RepID=A0A0D0Q830_9RHOB|nr:hypothetical protein Wenmar_02853 [Wenxinia marina DSM 24838]GGL67064.1 hypothetical protein GCM10011392_21960 [Wenxinia marina]